MGAAGSLRPSAGEREQWGPVCGRGGPRLCSQKPRGRDSEPEEEDDKMRVWQLRCHLFRAKQKTENGTLFAGPPVTDYISYNQ